MTIEKMSVHKALAELKIIDDRIYSAINNGTYVIANKHSNAKIRGVTVDEFRDQMKSDFQKVNDLITRRNAIKRAVVNSNATTTIEVNGVSYTIAEAIELKNHGMELKSALRECMKNQYARAKTEFDQNSGDYLEKRAEAYVLAVIQAQPKDSKMTADSEAMKSLRKQYISDNAYDIIDPIGIKEAIEKYSDEIDAFNTEINAALSCSNALTELEIEY